MNTKLHLWLVAPVCLLIFWCAATSRADLTLNISLSDTNALVTWINTDAALQTAPALDGAWNDVTGVARRIRSGVRSVAGNARLLAELSGAQPRHYTFCRGL